jgi:hypothetical protein
MSFSSRLFLHHLALLLTALMSTRYRYKHKHVLTIRDEDGLGMFQNRMSRNILPAKRNEVTEG